MFGFKLVGADICGFSMDTSDELCSRWHDLGAFYPFSRNHNDNQAKSQEPWNVGPLTLKSAQKSIFFRYSMIRYIYSQMFQSSVSGGVMFQPIFFQFPDDDGAYNFVDEHFMWGDALLVSPILTNSTDNITAYFPNANWNEFPSGKNFTDFNSTASAGQTYQLPGAFNNLNVHMRGGKIVPYQDAMGLDIFRTSHLQHVPTSIYINPDHNNNANGFVVFDDGISFDTISTKKYAKINFDLDNTTLTFTVENVFTTYTNDDILIASIVWFRASTFLQYDTIIAVDHQGNHLPGNIEIDRANDVMKMSFINNVRYDEISMISFSQSQK